MTSFMYTLDADGEPVPERDVLTWARWFEKADRTLTVMELDGVRVSTVFLGVNHNWGGGPPLLWETAVMIEGQSINVVQRHTSRDSALAAHDQIVASARDHLVGASDDD